MFLTANKVERIFYVRAPEKMFADW